MTASISGALIGRTSGTAQGDTPIQRPFPQHLIYTLGTIRPSHRTQEQQDDDVGKAYDAWKKNYLARGEGTADGKPRYRIAFAKPGDKDHDVTVSEGQGFGMVIIPHLAGYDPDAQTIFDGLWRFVRDNPSTIDDRLMNWHVPPDQNGSDSAFDGDCDIAYGLLLADAQWGSEGEIDYLSAAKEVIAGILESTIGPRSKLPMLGDWVEPDGDDYNQDTPRSSDFALGHFRAFERATGDSIWQAVTVACQTVITQLQQQFSPDTGLLPDFVEPVSKDDRSPRPADPDFLEGPNDGDYSYNAGRAPWRMATDALLNGDVVSLGQVQRISSWAEQTTNGKPERIRAGYDLEGTPLPESDYFSTFFASPLAVAAMTDKNQQQWLNDLYDSVYEETDEYYEDTVTLLCLLVLSANFWDPTV